MEISPICGIDEAGRGCWCGSLFVAAVVCNEETADFLKACGVKDSKQVKKPKRAQLAALITQTPNLRCHIAQKSAKEIDTLGLSTCLKNCLLEIIHHLKPYAQHFILDGNTTFGIHSDASFHLSTLIKGDSLLPQISAASILAKNAKDIEMQNLHRLYPQYGFLSHSGYGTKAHLKAIRHYGLLPFHRQSFLRSYF